MENTNFYVVHGWMINELKLSKTDLIVYAIIYGFSQDGESAYKGSRSYLAECANVSVTTIDNVLRNLVNSGNIKKFSKEINGIIFNSYKAVFPKLVHHPKNLGGNDKTCDNNKKNNNTKISTYVDTKSTDSKVKNKKRYADEIKTPEEIEFTEGMTKAYPHVMSMEKPLTLAEYNKLLAFGYTTEKVRDIFISMENYKKLKDKRCAYLTAVQWLKRQTT